MFGEPAVFINTWYWRAGFVWRAGQDGCVQLKVVRGAVGVADHGENFARVVTIQPRPRPSLRVVVYLPGHDQDVPKTHFPNRSIRAPGGSCRQEP